jgi:hypothetical protein
MLLARAQLHFSPIRQRLVVRVAVRVRTSVCACGSVVAAGCWLLAAAGGCCCCCYLLPAVCCLLSAACACYMLPAACCLRLRLRVLTARRTVPGRKRAQAKCLSASFARARRCPSGTALVLPFRNMLLFTSPSYHFKVLESKASISARAIVWGQNGNTFNLKFIGGQPPPKRNALWLELYFCELCVVLLCKLCCESVLKIRPPGGTKND